MTQPLVAVVDDDPAMLDMINAVLLEEGYQVLAWSEGRQAYDRIRQHRPDLVILDLRMEHPKAGWIIIHMLRLDPQTARIPVLVCTGDVQYVRTNAEMLRKNDCDVLLKPFAVDELVTHIARLLGRQPANEPDGRESEVLAEPPRKRPRLGKIKQLLRTSRLPAREVGDEAAEDA